MNRSKAWFAIADPAPRCPARASLPRAEGAVSRPAGLFSVPDGAFAVGRLGSHFQTIHLLTVVLGGDHTADIAAVLVSCGAAVARWDPTFAAVKRALTDGLAPIATTTDRQAQFRTLEICTEASRPREILLFNDQNVGLGTRATNRDAKHHLWRPESLAGCVRKRWRLRECDAAGSGPQDEAAEEKVGGGATAGRRSGRGAA